MRNRDDFNVTREEEKIRLEILKSIKIKFEPQFNNFLTKLFVSAIVFVFENYKDYYIPDLPQSFQTNTQLDPNEIQEMIAKAMSQFGKLL